MSQDNKDNTNSRPGFIPEYPSNSSPEKVPEGQLNYPSDKIQTK